MARTRARRRTAAAPPGYADLLGVLADPGHEDHDHFVSWVGGRFDQTAFDLGLVNAWLQKVR